MSNTLLSAISPLELYGRHGDCRKWMLARNIVKEITLSDGKTRVDIISSVCRLRNKKGEESTKLFALGYLKFEDLLIVCKGDWKEASEQFDLHEGYCFPSGTMVLPEKRDEK